MKSTHLLGMLLLVVGATTGPAFADKLVHKVNCDKGQTIGNALKHAEPGDTIRVTGVCTERVVIQTDRLTIDGAARHDARAHREALSRQHLRQGRCHWGGPVHRPPCILNIGEPDAHLAY